MSQKRSLTPAQIQYLKIGPKVGTSVTAFKKLQDSLSKFDIEGSDSLASLSNIPKFTYGNFQNTVNNFGVLLHRNFVGTTSLHQAQKFGNIAFSIDQSMQEQKDKPLETIKTGQKKAFSDSRTVLKAIYDYNEQKLLITLKSFSIQSLQAHRIIQTFSLPYLKLITSHVNSSKLVKMIDSVLKQQGTTVAIEYDKIESKVGHTPNSQTTYLQGPYLLERSGQQFTINLPSLEIYHSESDYREIVSVQNKDILEMLESDLDNVEAIVRKYFDFASFEAHIDKGEQNKSEQA